MRRLTAGLPLRLTDLIPFRVPDPGSALAAVLGLPDLQIECSGTAALVMAVLTGASLPPTTHPAQIAQIRRRGPRGRRTLAALPRSITAACLRRCLTARPLTAKR